MTVSRLPPTSAPPAEPPPCQPAVPVQGDRAHRRPCHRQPGEANQAHARPGKFASPKIQSTGRNPWTSSRCSGRSKGRSWPSPAAFCASASRESARSLLAALASSPAGLAARARRSGLLLLQPRPTSYPSRASSVRPGTAVASDRRRAPPRGYASPRRHVLRAAPALASSARHLLCRPRSPRALARASSTEPPRRRSPARPCRT